jgi:hypothetical protein
MDGEIEVWVEGVAATGGADGLEGVVDAGMEASTEGGKDDTSEGLAVSVAVWLQLTRSVVAAIEKRVLIGYFIQLC